jgi:phosphoglycolate phosphatase
MKILHFAPEEGLSRLFAERAGDGYQPVDINPARYRHCQVRRFDLVTDSESLPNDAYDMIVHVHVMEHIPCNWTAVLFHLHRALRPDGFHIFCLPIMGGFYEECLADLGPEENAKRFGQWDHVRRFGARDIEKTLGMVFKLPVRYDLEQEFGAEVLDAHSIPRYSRFGMNCDTILVMRKDDLKLAVPGR